MHTENRLQFLDISKGIGILLIIFGHVTTIENPLDIWMSSFKITIFFIITGFLLNHTNAVKNYTFKIFVHKLFKTLLIPYFFVSILTIIFYMFLYSEGNVLYSLFSYLYMTFTFRGLSTLWFLPSLFIGEILFYVIHNSQPYLRKLSFIIPLLIIYLIDFLLINLQTSLNNTLYQLLLMPMLTISKGLVAFWFILIGYHAYTLTRKITKKLTVGFILFLFNVFLSSFNNNIDLNMLNFGTYPILFFIGGILGSISILLIFESLQTFYEFPFLRFCGLNSLLLMVTHLPFGIAIILFVYNKYFEMPMSPTLPFYMHSLLIFVCLMIVEFFFIKVSKMIPNIPTGKRTKE